MRGLMWLRLTEGRSLVSHRVQILLGIPIALTWPGVVFAPIAAALAGLIAFLYYFAVVLEDWTERLLPKKVRSKSNAEQFPQTSAIKSV